MRNIPNIEFVCFNKKKGLLAYLDLYRTLQRRRFDLLLLMQLSLRANLIPLFIRAETKLGFDRARSRNLHHLFINKQIEPQKNQHVLDSFLGFMQTLGLTPRLVWDRCYTEADAELVRQKLPVNNKILVISPCSRHPMRNWMAENYAEIADYAISRYAMSVVLTGDKAPAERELCQSIDDLTRNELVNLSGATSLPELVAVLAQADVMLSPDSGPAHLATCVGTPVIGLYAVANPKRTGPYLSARWCVNLYPTATEKYLGKSWQDLPWGTRVRTPAAMQLITPDRVKAKLDDFMLSLKC